jgi:exocyst complex protein 7
MNFYLKMLEAERKICMKVVLGVQRHAVYSEVVAPSVSMFIEKGTYLANKNRTSEKVFVLLDVLENFEKKMPEFEQVLQHTPHYIRLQELSPIFKKSISKLLGDLKDEIEKNEIEAFADGAIHQVTSNAFSFLRRLLDYEKTVENLLQTEFFGRTVTTSNIHKTFIGKYIQRILKAIDVNIETKSKQFKQKSLAAVFCLNNHFYVLKKLQHQRFKKHIHETIIADVQKQVKKDEEDYISITWDKALSYLKDESKLVMNSKKTDYTTSAKKEMKNKLKNFNEQFSNTYHTQRSYSIRDLELKEKIRNATIQTVIPVYKNFVDKYGKVDFSKKNKSKYICYDERTMEDMILQYFDEERDDTE